MASFWTATVVLTVAACLACVQPVAGGNQALVGMYYTSWMSGPHNWAVSWGTPLLGQYNSKDTKVIEQHHKWLKCAGVDFVVLDWSNNIQCASDYTLNPPASTCGDPAPRFVEDATINVFNVFKRLGGIKIAIMIGSPTNANDYRNGGRMFAAAQKVYDMFVASPEYRDLYFYYQGKPLLVDYVFTPVPFNQWGTVLPEWNDGRFTTRHMTGFLSDQSFLLNAPGGDVSKYGYWSWEDRNKNVWSLNPDGTPEATVINAAVRGDCARGPPTNPPNTPWGCPGGQSRRGGRTFLERWQRAISAGVDLVMVQSWNEWVGPTEEFNAEFSNDLEPTRELGNAYLQALAANVKNYKDSKGVPVAFCNAINEGPTGK